MLAQTFGRLRQEADERRGVRFERVYDYRPDELWAALTEPEQIRGWLGEAEVDLRVGGAIVIRFGDSDDETVTGRIRALEPHRLLEYEWRYPGETESILRIEFEPREKGTLLVLDHRRLMAEAATGYAAGWHSHLDALELLLVGRDHDWEGRFEELRPRYMEQAQELPAESGLGTLRREDDRRGVHFERLLPAPSDRVWDALVQPDQLCAWLGAEHVELEPRAGGRVYVRWSDRESMEGAIAEFGPPRVLAYTWHERGDRSTVRFELLAADDGTRLLLDHHNLPTDGAVSFGSGWHAHLDWLEAHLEGRGHDFWARYRELTPLYEDLAAGL